MNQALLGEWIWRLGTEDISLCNKIIKSKYGKSEGGWWSKDSSRYRALALWKGIISMQKELLKGIDFELGKGCNIQFWKDRWVGDVPLKENFPIIFSLAPNQAITVADCYTASAGKIEWNVECRRNLQDWEIQEYADLLDCIYKALPNPLVEDKLIWRKAKSSKFSVKSFYNQLDFPASNDDSLCKQIWKYSVPPKIIAFGWLVSKKSILPVDNLRKKGMCLVNICLCCMKTEESVDHLLLHGPFILSIWADFCDRFSINWCSPDSVVSLFKAWHGARLCKHRSRLWRMALLAIWWSVWEERNGKCFGDIANSACVVSSKAKRLVLEWAVHVDSLKDYDLLFLEA